MCPFQTQIILLECIASNILRRETTTMLLVVQFPLAPLFLPLPQPLIFSLIASFQTLSSHVFLLGRETKFPTHP